MRVKRKLTSQAEFNAVPVHLKECYTRNDDGSFSLQVEDEQTADEMKAELDQNRAELRQHKEKRAWLREAFGDDESTWRTQWDELMERASRDVPEPLSKEQFEQTMAEHEAEHAAKLAEIDTRRKPEIDSLNAAILELERDRALTAAMTQAGLPSDVHFLLAPTIRSHVRASMDESGAVQVAVIDKSGQPRLHPDGTPVGVDHLLTEMKLLDPKMARFFSNGGLPANGNGSAH